MVNEDDTNHQAEQVRADMSTTDGAHILDSKSDERNIIITASTNGNERSENSGSQTLTRTVKREIISPKSGTPPTYPTPANNASLQTSAETMVSATVTDRRAVERAREQLLLGTGGLSHVISQSAMAASVYNHQERFLKSGTWRPVLPFLGGQHFEQAVTHAARNKVPNDSKNDENPSIAECMTPHGVRATERSCVSDDSPTENAVSKRKPQAAASTGEPLDLSQSNGEGSVAVQMNESRAKMLLEGKMNVECVSNGKHAEAPERETDEDIQRKVKKEVLDNEAPNGKHNETSPQAVERIPEDRVPINNVNVRSVDLGYEQSFRGAFTHYPHPWMNFPTAVLNPAFLPQTFAGYIPAGLAGAAAHPALACMDPTALPHRNDLAGLSQWVNLLRQIPVAVGDHNTERKRKCADTVRERMPSDAEDQGEHEVPDSTENPKRFRARETPDGLHRSASDDSGKSRLKDEEASKSKLKRRNSAPLAGTMPQTPQEEQKKVASMDLLSYRGCLPPHYLALLRASGNLVTDRENTLRDVENVYPIRPVIRNTSANEKHASTLPSDIIARQLPPRGSAVPHEVHDDFARSVQRVPSPRYTKKTTADTYRESISLPRHKMREGGHSKINYSASVPIYPRGLFNGHQSHERRQGYRKISGSFSDNARRRGNDIRIHRDSRGSESDDDDHIEKLQISDASSDEEEEAVMNRCKIELPARSSPVSSQGSKNLGAIEFGKGSWADLDTGKLPAFCGNIAVPNNTRADGQFGRLFSEVVNAPTKMPCSVSRNFPQALNGLPRVYCTSKIFTTERNARQQEKALASEFASHDAITEPRKEFRIQDLKLPIKSVLKGSRKHKCSGCDDDSKRDENRRKLIGNIFRQSNDAMSSSEGYHRSTPRCMPRLVFTSELQLPSNVPEQKTPHGSELTKDHELGQPKSSSDVGAIRHTEIVQTSAGAYSHKLFSFARATKEADSSSVSVTHGVDSRSKNSPSSPGDKKPSRVPGSVVLASRTKSNTSASARLSSLDAKLEELRQKATEREEQRSEANSHQKEKTSEMQAVPESMKTEVIASLDKTSRSPHVHLHTARKPSTSPFYENDSNRFVGRRNVAVIKPNQAITGTKVHEDTQPDYVCPPKKRHVKRYSPEFYNKPTVDSTLQNREVRSASPSPHAPFVSTNVVINNDDHSLNVRWCSPERNSSRRKVPGSNSRTILTCRVPLGQRVRGGNSHTVTLERNYRKFPRCVPSPRSDAVIVVESRMAENPVDQRDERLEIEDLEISDDET